MMATFQIKTQRQQTTTTTKTMTSCNKRTNLKQRQSGSRSTTGPTAAMASMNKKQQKQEQQQSEQQQNQQQTQRRRRRRFMQQQQQQRILQNSKEDAVHIASNFTYDPPTAYTLFADATTTTTTTKTATTLNDAFPMSMPPTMSKKTYMYTASIDEADIELDDDVDDDEPDDSSSNNADIDLDTDTDDTVSTDCSEQRFATLDEILDAAYPVTLPPSPPISLLSRWHVMAMKPTQNIFNMVAARTLIMLTVVVFVSYLLSFKGVSAAQRDTSYKAKDLSHTNDNDIGLGGNGNGNGNANSNSQNSNVNIVNGIPKSIDSGIVNNMSGNNNNLNNRTTNSQYAGGQRSTTTTTTAAAAVAGVGATTTLAAQTTTANHGNNNHNNNNIASSNLQKVSNFIASKDRNTIELTDDGRNNIGPYFDKAASKNVTALLGKTAYLNCRVKNLGNKTMLLQVSWVRHRDIHLLTVGRYTYTSDQRFRAIHQPQTEDWILQIKYPQHRDSGVYECQVSTTPHMSHYIHLNVVEPSTEIIGAPDLYIESGSTINLTCVILNSPEPPAYIFWNHNSAIINYDSPRGGVSVVTNKGDTTTSFLLIKSARPSDSGHYQCNPSNAKPKSVTVHVLNGEFPAAMQHAAQAHPRMSHTHYLLVYLCVCLCSSAYIRYSLRPSAVPHHVHTTGNYMSAV